MISRTGSDFRLVAALPLLVMFAVAPPTLAGSPVAPFVGMTFEDVACVGDSVGNGSGPWDYLERAGLQQSLRLVENHHFTPQVEMLVRGQTAVKPIGDIIFTLTYWPNHHRALNSLSIYSMRVEASGERLHPPAECWMERAIHFSPKDATARMLFAVYLHRSGLNDKAKEQYEVASQQAPQDLQIAYNYGLLMFDMENYSEASKLANKVYSGGFPLPGLRKKLAGKGYTVP